MIKVDFKINKNTALAHMRLLNAKTKDAGCRAVGVGAAFVLSEAIKRCPHDTGRLDGSGRIAPETPSTSKIIIFDVDYAAIVHEWPANHGLGPKSKSRAAFYGTVVGGKFLARAHSDNKTKIDETVRRIYKNLGGK